MGNIYTKGMRKYSSIGGRKITCVYVVLNLARFQTRVIHKVSNRDYLVWNIVKIQETKLSKKSWTKSWTTKWITTSLSRSTKSWRRRISTRMNSSICISALNRSKQIFNNFIFVSKFQTCPNGYVNRQQFCQIYRSFFAISPKTGWKIDNLKQFLFQMPNPTPTWFSTL